MLLLRPSARQGPVRRPWTTSSPPFPSRAWPRGPPEWPNPCPALFKGCSTILEQGHSEKKVPKKENNTEHSFPNGVGYPIVFGRVIFHEWCKAVAADTLRMAVNEAEAKMKSKAGVIGKSEGGELGMKLDSGYLSPHFVTDLRSQKCELENPLILINEKKLHDTGSVEELVELASKKKRPLLIVAEDIGSDALGSLILCKLSSGVKVCAIKAPGLGDNRKASLQNLANITGADVITQELGIDLHNVRQEMLGTCKKVIISKNDAIIHEGAGAKKPTKEKSAEEKDIELVKMHSSESEFLLKFFLEEEKKLEKRQKEKMKIIFKKFIQQYQPKRGKPASRR